jgi:hypothetical protein
MKRTLITLLIASMFFIGCEEPGKDGQVTMLNFGSGVSVVEVDGCEYVRYYQTAITHKANCHNPIHKPKSDTITIKK